MPSKKEEILEDVDNLILKIEEKCPTCNSLLQPLDKGYWLCTYCHRMFRGKNKKEVKRIRIKDDRWN